MTVRIIGADPDAPVVRVSQHARVRRMRRSLRAMRLRYQNAPRKRVEAPSPCVVGDLRIVYSWAEERVLLAMPGALKDAEEVAPCDPRA